MRNQPGEASRLLSPEPADFREKGENGSGGNLSDAGDRAQDVALACARRILGDASRDLGVELAELPLDQGEACVGLTLQRGTGQDQAAVAQTPPLLD